MKPGDIVRAFFNQKKVISRPDVNALIEIGYLLIGQDESIPLVGAGKYHAGKFVENGETYYYVAKENGDDPVFLALSEPGSYTIGTYTPGTWQFDLSQTYRIVKADRCKRLRPSGQTTFN